MTNKFYYYSHCTWAGGVLIMGHPWIDCGLLMGRPFVRDTTPSRTVLDHASSVGHVNLPHLIKRHCCCVCDIEGINVLLELPRSLRRFLTCFTFGKAFPSDKVFFLWQTVLLPYDAVCHVAFYVLIIGGFHSKEHSLWFASIQIILICMERFQHTYMEHMV